MKAKLKVSWDFNRVEIEKDTEVTIIKGMEADAADVLNAPYGMCYLCELDGCMTYVPANYLIITDWDNIDWEQRRYELAKEYSKEFIMLQHEKGRIDCGCSVSDVVEWSVEFADSLIAELKKTKKV